MPNEPTLVRGRSTRIVAEKPVEIVYAYMARRSTIFDEQLIADAERRAALLAKLKVEK